MIATLLTAAVLAASCPTPGLRRVDLPEGGLSCANFRAAYREAVKRLDALKLVSPTVRKHALSEFSVTVMSLPDTVKRCAGHPACSFVRNPSIVLAENAGALLHEFIHLVRWYWDDEPGGWTHEGWTEAMDGADYDFSEAFGPIPAQ
jgi:hypothetical protein